MGEQEARLRFSTAGTGHHAAGRLARLLDCFAQRLAKFKLPKRVNSVADLRRNDGQRDLLRETFKDLFVSRACNCS